MNNYATVAEAESENGQLHSARRAAASALHLVTHYDLENLRSVLAKGILPPDFESKLAGLAKQSLLHQFVEQNCRLFIALLLAAQGGSFTEASQTDRDRLLRVLTYVRKDDDAIADYKPNGFTDDQREVRAATTEMSGLIQRFKQWRLRHQVPGMWRSESSVSGLKRV